MKSVGYWQYASNCWFNYKEEELDIDLEYLYTESDSKLESESESKSESECKFECEFEFESDSDSECESESELNSIESNKNGWFVKLFATFGFLTGLFFVATEIKSKKKKVYYKILDSE